MKKLLIIICAALSALPAVAQRQKTPNRARMVEAANIVLTHKSGNVTVQFRLNVGRRAARLGEELVVTPMLRNGEEAVRLAPINIYGGRSKVLGKRHELGLGGGGRFADEQPQQSFRVNTGGSLEYSTVIPYQLWMRGGELVLDGVSVRGANPEEALMGVIAEDVLQAAPAYDTRLVARPAPAVQPQPQPQPQYNTGERLSQQYSFVASAADYKGTMERNYVDRAYQGALSIFFRQGSGSVDPYYNDNGTRLHDLADAVSELQRSPDVRISKIVVSGFASPEGGNVVNVPLAWDRAVVVKRYLMRTLGIPAHLIETYSGGVDYATLRKLVLESDMWQREQIADIIDRTPVWDAHSKVGVHGELMRLDGGQPYRYMYRHFFPLLRQAAMVKIYYETGEGINNFEQQRRPPERRPLFNDYELRGRMNNFR